MYIKKECDFYELKKNSWSGAVETLEKIEEEGKEDELMQLLEEEFSGEAEETELNDFLWFEDDYIFKNLEIGEE